jgi:hypothetical protein
MERRVLKFAAGDKGFVALYNLAVLGHLMTAQIPKGQPDSRELDQARKDAKALRALHAISEVDDGNKTSTGEKHRICTGGELVLQTETYERLLSVAKMAMTRVPDEILIASEDALDMLINAETRKDDESKS